MRKIVLILVVLALLPAVAFADLGVGGAAFFKSPVLLGQPISREDLNTDQFSFGGNVRFKWNWLQAEGLALYSAGEIGSFNVYLDAGVALDLSLLRLSVGAGPNFVYTIGEEAPIQTGLNAKIGADVMLGSVSVGLSYIMQANFSNRVTVATRAGLLGAQVLFWF